MAEGPKRLRFCTRSEYTDRTGEQRGSWHEVFQMFWGKNGKPYAKLNSNPEVLLYGFEIDEYDPEKPAGGGGLQQRQEPRQQKPESSDSGPHSPDKW